MFVDPKWPRRIERKSSRLFSAGCWSLMWRGVDIWTSWLASLGCYQCRECVLILHKSENEGEHGVKYGTCACQFGSTRVLALPSLRTWLRIGSHDPRKGRQKYLDENNKKSSRNSPLPWDYLCQPPTELSMGSLRISSARLGFFPFVPKPQVLKSLACMSPTMPSQGIQRNYLSEGLHGARHGAWRLQLQQLVTGNLLDGC
jgi:hypothetical protein